MMNYRNLYYISVLNPAFPFIGVINKIAAQANSFQKAGYKVSTINLYRKVENRSLFGKIMIRLNPFVDLSNSKDLIIIARSVSNSIFYFRFTLFDFYFLKSLKTLKQNNNIVVIEFPTYPFRKEIPIKRIQFYYMHLFYKIFIKRYIDFIVTYSNHKRIYNIECIRISNGIDINQVPVKTQLSLNDDINAIVVASLSFWHGVDRIIKGLADYYKGNFNRNIILHIVGDGSEKILLQNLVSSLNLSNRVVFYGSLKGKELDLIFEKMHLGVASLGCHRKNLKFTSELKTREYCARGLPFIISANLPDFPIDFKYVKYFPSDESNIDIKKVIEFTETLYKDPFLSNKMRNWAINNLQWDKKLEPVILKLVDLSQKK